MSSPTVSVILPVYNGEAYLRSAIGSVFAQSLPDVELIVVDDGSTDGTAAIARELGPRLTYVRQANTGVAGAFNHGLRLASGRFISWLSHDDVFLPEKLERQVAALARLGSPGVCYTDLAIIDADGAVMAEVEMPEYERQRVLRHLVTGGPICSACYSLMYDRACIDEVGPYAEQWKCTQDVEMLMRLVRRFPLIRVPETLMQVRDHGKRGVASPACQREAQRFYRHQLQALPLGELFPEAPERKAAYAWLGATLTRQPYPIYRVAYAQYRRTLEEGRWPDRRAVGGILGLAIRESLELVLCLVRALPFGQAALRRLHWRLAAAHMRWANSSTRKGH